MDKNFDDTSSQSASRHFVAQENGIRGVSPTSLQAESNEIGTTRTPPEGLLGEFTQFPSIAVSGITALRRRFWITVVGVAIGIGVAILIAGPMSGVRSINDRAWIWLTVMSGPVIGTYLGMYTPSIMCGWLGLFTVPARSVRPSSFTAVVTLVGLGFWFRAGWEVIRHFG